VAAIAPDSPQQLLERFLAAGWKVVDEGARNWLVAYGDDEDDDGEPFVVPKDGDHIGFDVMRKAHSAIERARERNS